MLLFFSEWVLSSKNILRILRFANCHYHTVAPGNECHKECDMRTLESLYSEQCDMRYVESLTPSPTMAMIP